MSIEVSPSPISNTLVDKDAYLSGLLDKVVASKSEGWLQEVRESAADWVRQSKLPTTRDEEWRFADLSSLREVQFNVETFLPNITPFSLPEANNSRLVLLMVFTHLSYQLFLVYLMGWWLAIWLIYLRVMMSGCGNI
jgi:Fe-S cluster assembly protein SufD